MPDEDCSRLGRFEPTFSILILHPQYPDPPPITNHNPVIESRHGDRVEPEAVISVVFAVGKKAGVGPNWSMKPVAGLRARSGVIITEL